MARVCPCQRMGLDSVKAGPRGRPARWRGIPVQDRGVCATCGAWSGLGGGRADREGAGRLSCVPEAGPHIDAGACRPPWDSCPVLLGLFLELSILQNQSVLVCCSIELCSLPTPVGFARELVIFQHTAPAELS